MAQTRERLQAQTCGHRMHLHLDKFPAWRQAEWIFIGCADPGSASTYEAAAACREAFWRLSLPHESFSVADLGDFAVAAEESSQLLEEVMFYLLEAGKRVLLLGGDPKNALPQIRAAHRFYGLVTWVDVDSRFDMRDSAAGPGPDSVKHFALTREDDKIFSYTNLGYQRPLTTSGELEAIHSLHHEAIRYGLLQEDIISVEPPLRTAHVLNVDLGAVRLADAPGAFQAPPGGFSATEIFRLARYAGLAYELTLIHLHGWHPELDLRDQTSQLVAHLCWYLMDGFYNQQPDYPLEDRSNVRRYTVKLHASIEQIDFYRHMITDRWWMEVPHPDSLGEANGQVHLIACSERDYETARMDDIPERWWSTFQKLKP